MTPEMQERLSKPGEFTVRTIRAAVNPAPDRRFKRCFLSTPVVPEGTRLLVAVLDSKFGNRVLVRPDASQAGALELGLDGIEAYTNGMDSPAGRWIEELLESAGATWETIDQMVQRIEFRHVEVADLLKELSSMGRPHEFLLQLMRSAATGQLETKSF